MKLKNSPMQNALKIEASPMRRQRGVVLLVALVVVLVMSIIGLAAIKGSGLQELMAGNQRDRNIAFQAAETGLREGETEVSGGVLPVFGNANGLFTQLGLATTKALPQTWTLDQWVADGALAKTAIPYVDSQPRYVVEKLDFDLDATNFGSAVDVESAQHSETSTVYRVTARASGFTSDSYVILQSTFIR